MLPKIVLMGTLGRDPDFRDDDQGKRLRLGVEVYSFYESGGNQKYDFHYFNVVVTGDTAEQLNMELMAGSQVLVSGELMHDNGNPRIFDIGGVHRSVYEVKAYTVISCLGRLTQDQLDDEEVKPEGWHRVAILGNLGSDPETKEFQSGSKVTNFSIAGNSGSGQNKETVWTRVSAWGKRGEVVATYFAKGDSIYLEGSLQADRAPTQPDQPWNRGGPRIWYDGSGNPRASFELTMVSFEFTGKSSGGGGQQQVYQPVDDNEIPF